ncbi:MAG: hypothetical protein JRH11_02900 [Deltaproteobacteria bacterium]|nr:hypothetical protein [Deltaproteobacteria bacterium]
MCDNRVTGLAGVSQHSAMIAEALMYVPPCISSPERCNDVDDDCNGIVDDGCGELGEPCTLAEECRSARCESVAGEMLCTAECDPTLRDACEPGLACEADACGTGRCVPAGAGAAGDECSARADCGSARCVASSGVSRCGEACVPEGAACATTLVCEAPDGVCGTCLPEALAVSPRLFGDPCNDGARCASGACEAGRCSRACDSAAPCPDGSHCRGAICIPGGLGGAGDRCQTEEDCRASAPSCAEPEQLCAVPCNELGRCAVGFECVADSCLPLGAALGETCVASSECRSDRCEGGACTRTCDAADPCAAGFECADAGATESLCVPGRESGGCSTSAWSDTGTAGGTPGAILVALLLLARRRRPGVFG